MYFYYYIIYYLKKKHKNKEYGFFRRGFKILLMTTSKLVYLCNRPMCFYYNSSICWKKRRVWRL